MAEAYGKLTGAPGHLPRHARPRRDQRLDRRPHRLPGLDADDPVHRPGRQRHASSAKRSRRSTTGACSAPMAKWVAQIDRAERIPEFVAPRLHRRDVRAARARSCWRCPRTCWSTRSTCPTRRPYVRVQAHPGAAEMERLRELLAAAERPLVIVGGGGWSATGCEDLAAFCEANELPVAGVVPLPGLVDNRSRAFVGDVGVGINPALAERVRDADLLLVVGARLGEMTTGGYTLVEPAAAEADARPRPRRRRGARPRLPADARDPRRRARVRRRRERLSCAERRRRSAARLARGGARRLPGDARAAAGAGGAEHERGRSPSCASACPPTRSSPTAPATSPSGRIASSRTARFRTQLAPTSGAMGYGVPGGDRREARRAGAHRRLLRGRRRLPDDRPGARDRRAVRRRRSLFIVVNNGMYGTIRMHQEREYPGRVDRHRR